MKNVIISLISLALISACEVNVNNDVKMDAEPAPFARVVEPEVLPTTDPLETFLMPASFNPTITKAPETMSAQDDLNAFKLYIREGGVQTRGPTVYTVYNAFLESESGSQMAYATIFFNVPNNYMMVCASNSPSDMSWSCTMLIRNMKWINSNTASYELCHRGTVGAATGYATEGTCVTKYSNE